MSHYQVLARKWRPHNFKTIVGQDHVVTALTRALDENRLHHAYLFTGTRGVGKTTISRIFAKALNCVGPDGQGKVTSEPCGVCEVCRAIDEGRFPDYIEMDAASNRSVEDMHALLERSVYAPTHGRYKVYMIDEVHMLSNTAFNAMLKTLEEPPEYVKFILATTDPQKVPMTVLSRCLQFHLRNMTPQGIVGHMSHILDAEKVPYEVPALQLLAQGARGSMRDGLSLLDQAMAYCGDTVATDKVRHMLGMSGEGALEAVMQAVVDGDAPRLLQLADQMLAESVSFGQVMRDLANLLHRMALLQRVPQAMDSQSQLDEQALRFSAQLSPQEVQLYYQIVIHGRNELALAPDEYAGFTMTLLRLLAFKPSGFKGDVPPRGAWPKEGKPETPVKAVPPTASTATPSAPTPTPKVEKPVATTPAFPPSSAPATGGGVFGDIAAPESAPAFLTEVEEPSFVKSATPGAQHDQSTPNSHAYASEPAVSAPASSEAAPWGEPWAS